MLVRAEDSLCLHERLSHLTSRMLRAIAYLHEIGDIAIVVNAPSVEPGSGPFPTQTRYQS